MKEISAPPYFPLLASEFHVTLAKYRREGEGLYLYDHEDMQRTIPHVSSRALELTADYYSEIL